MSENKCIALLTERHQQLCPHRDSYSPCHRSGGVAAARNKHTAPSACYACLVQRTSSPLATWAPPWYQHGFTPYPPPGPLMRLSSYRLFGFSTPASGQLSSDSACPRSNAFLDERRQQRNVFLSWDLNQGTSVKKDIRVTSRATGTQLFPYFYESGT